ncbi:MAG TPA: hypothetical protein VMH20_07610 [Verrucomicrobiae bacterium]|nr:hypothetical protein [Verrucomicrobiae bacterium]
MARCVAMFVCLGLSYAVAAGGQTPQNIATQASATPAASAARASGPISLPNGTRFVGKLTTKLDTKHAKVGQPLVVEVKKDVKSGEQVVLKKGSLVKGTVTAVTPYAKGGSGAEVDISFDSVGDKNEEQIPAHFAIYALSAKLEKQPDDMYNSGGKQRMATSASISGQVVAPHDNELRPETTGIFGFTDLELHPLVKMTPPTSTVNCKSGNIVLENGTELVLVAVGQ